MELEDTKYRVSVSQKEVMEGTVKREEGKKNNKKIQKNLRISKKSSTFALAFEKKGRLAQLV